MNESQSTHYQIRINKSEKLKAKPQTESLGFGQHFTDHMFVARYSKEKGWYDLAIQPYQPLQLDPAASVLHYGQALFEGMKAFRQENGDIALFRTQYNWQRMVFGAERLCMEAPPLDLFQEAVRKLVDVDRDWIPQTKGSALYIRPTLIGTEGFLGVRPSDEYIFFIILSPVGAYYKDGLKPVSIWVEEKYSRAAPGGLGATKAGANYAGSLKAASEAKKQGCSQVLWLDTEKKYVEEVGTMNVFFVFKNEIATPSLDGTILAGGVRQCIIEMLRQWRLPIVERKVSLEEIKSSVQNGNLREVFGTGTAAVVSPVGRLCADQWTLQIGSQTGQMGELTQKIYKELTDIQYGLKLDEYHWIEKI